MDAPIKINSIAVTDFNNSPIDLILKYNEKPLLLIFYNNQCLGCTGRAIPLAYELQNQFKSIQVIGIHSDFGQNQSNEKEIKAIFTSGEIPFPIYLDRNHKVYDEFNAEGTPQWILIAKNRTIFRSIFGSQLGSQNRLQYALEELVG